MHKNEITRLKFIYNITSVSQNMLVIEVEIAS